MAWDDWKGFETPQSRIGRGMYQNWLAESGMEPADFARSLGYETPEGPAVGYEGQLFGQFAQLLGMSPAEAEQKYNEYVNRAGGIENAPLRTKIPLDMLVGEYGGQLPPQAVQWWTQVGRNQAEEGAQAWQDAKMSQGGFLKQYAPLLGVVAPMLVGPAVSAMGLTGTPASLASGVLQGAIGGAGGGLKGALGSAVLGGAGSAAGSAIGGNLGSLASAATKGLGGLVLGSLNKPEIRPRTTYATTPADIATPQQQPAAENAPLSAAVTGDTQQAAPIETISGAVMKTSQPSSNVITSWRQPTGRPQIRYTPGFRRGYA